jgi:hypothetical protein
MLKKIPKEPEIFASKVDPSAVRKKRFIFLEILTLKARTGELTNNRGFHIVNFS